MSFYEVYDFKKLVSCTFYPQVHQFDISNGEVGEFIYGDRYLTRVIHSFTIFIRHMLVIPRLDVV